MYFNIIPYIFLLDFWLAKYCCDKFILVCLWSGFCQGGIYFWNFIQVEGEWNWMSLKPKMSGQLKECDEEGRLKFLAKLDRYLQNISMKNMKFSWSSSAGQGCKLPTSHKPSLKPPLSRPRPPFITNPLPSFVTSHIDHPYSPIITSKKALWQSDWITRRYCNAKIELIVTTHKILCIRTRTQHSIHFFALNYVIYWWNQQDSITIYQKNFTLLVVKLINDFKESGETVLCNSNGIELIYLLVRRART